MVALLREPDVRDDALGDSERALLEPMIQRSDNQAATAIYNRVGEGALYELADDAGLDHFTTQPTWGLTTITAGAQARFFYRLESFIPRRHRAYAMRLLTRIVLSSAGGSRRSRPRGWRLHFKGGWSGAPELAREPGDAAAQAAAAVRGRDPHPRAALEGLRRAIDRGRRAAAAARLRRPRSSR